MCKDSFYLNKCWTCRSGKITTALLVHKQAEPQHINSKEDQGEQQPQQPVQSWQMRPQ